MRSFPIFYLLKATVGTDSEINGLSKFKRWALVSIYAIA